MSKKHEIIQQKKSALVDSTLGALFEQFHSQTHGTYTIKGGRDASLTTLRDVIAALKKPKPSKEDLELSTTFELHSEDALGNTVKLPLTVEQLNRLWAAPAFKLSERWSTPAAFVQEMIPAFDDYKSKVVAHRQQIAEVATDATRMIYEGNNVKRDLKWAYLGTTWAPRTVNDADNEFLYSHLRQNCGALYWVHNGFSLPLPRDERSGEIIQDAEFWDLWERSCAPLLGSYLDTALEIAEQLRTCYPEDEETGLPIESVDSLIGAEIPRVILRNLAIGTERYADPDDEGKYKFERFRLSIKKHVANTRSVALEDWEAVLAGDMVKGLSMENVKPIKQFSNGGGEALCYVSLDGVDVSGAHGAELANGGMQPPDLPPTWSRFLCGVDGHTSIFENDPRMCLLRLAWFVVQVVQDNGCKCRQILCLSGSGNDGKSVAVDLISDLVDTGAVALKADKLSEDSQTYPALNRALVCLPECKKPSEIFRSPFVKSVTGGDAIALRKLYAMPIQWRPEHTRILMTTNARTYVSNENEISRLLPLAFHRNYKPSEQQTLEWFRANCLAERVPFLQWCFDTLSYYKTIRNANGGSFGVFKANGLSIITDEAYHRWLAGELALDDGTDWDSLIKAAIEGCGSGRFHVSLSEETSEDEEELFSRIAHSLLEFTGSDEDWAARVEIAEALQKAGGDKYHPAGVFIRTAGLCGEAITRKPVYSSFLKYLKSQANIAEGKRNGERGFRGLKLNSSGDLLTNNEQAE